MVTFCNLRLILARRQINHLAPLFQYFLKSRQKGLDIVDHTLIDDRKKPPLSPKNFVKGGVPDLVFTLPPDGRTAFVEIKAPGGKLSRVQIAFRNRWERAGALWAVACSIDDMAGIFDLWKIRYRGSVAMG